MSNGPETIRSAMRAFRKGTIPVQPPSPKCFARYARTAPRHIPTYQLPPPPPSKWPDPIYAAKRRAKALGLNIPLHARSVHGIDRK